MKTIFKLADSAFPKL